MMLKCVHLNHGAQLPRCLEGVLMVLWCRHQRGQNVEGRLEAREREQ